MTKRARFTLRGVDFMVEEFPHLLSLEKFRATIEQGDQLLIQEWGITAQQATAKALARFSEFLDIMELADEGMEITA